MDEPRLARYPFLQEAAAFVRAEGPDVHGMLTGRVWGGARSQGRARVEAALEGDPVPPVMATDDAEALVGVVGYAVARLLVSCVDDKLMTNRYATAEARRLFQNLMEDNEDVLVTVSRELGLRVEPIGSDGPGGPGQPNVPAGASQRSRFTVPFTDYLRATVDISALEWKLVNQVMDHGLVVLERDKVARLCQEAYKLRLLEDLPLAVPPDVPKGLAPWPQEIRTRLAEVRSRQTELEFGDVEPEVFPPCIRSIITAIKNGENMSHEGRFAVVSFLNTVGMGRDAIINELFPSVPDFAKEITEYQVDHITGKKGKEAYTPPACSSLQTYGLCPMMGRTKSDWDAWCAHDKMNHPLTYYRWGLFKMEKRAERRGGGQDQGDDRGDDQRDGQGEDVDTGSDGATAEAPSS